MKPMNLPREQPDDVNTLLTIKLALKYVNMRNVKSMHAIARAHQGRNLADFEKALRDYRNGNCILPPFPLPSHAPSFPSSLPMFTFAYPRGY